MFSLHGLMDSVFLNTEIDQAIISRVKPLKYFLRLIYQYIIYYTKLFIIQNYKLFE